MAFPGSIFQIGDMQSVVDVVSGKYHKIPFSLFFYNYITHNGGESRTHKFTIFKFQVDSNTPNILLENKKHDFGESLLKKISLKVPLSLEGDFNNYFRLSVPKGHEIEALQIFTPDIMLDLEEKCRSLSLEIIGDQLYLYKDSTVNSKEELYSFYECAKYFEDKLAPVLSRMTISKT